MGAGVGWVLGAVLVRHGVAELAEHHQRVALAGLEQEHLVEDPGGGVHVALAGEPPREAEHLPHGLGLIARLDEDVAELLPQLARARQLLDGLEEQRDGVVVVLRVAVRVDLHDDLSQAYARLLNALRGGGRAGLAEREGRRRRGRGVLVEDDLLGLLQLELDRGRLRRPRGGCAPVLGRRTLGRVGPGRAGGLGVAHVVTGRAHRGELADALVERRAREEGLDERVEVIELARVLGDAGRLLLHLDRLGGLVELVEGAREEREGLEVLRVLLEADLQLGERRHRVGRLAALEVDLGGDAGELDVGAVLEEPLHHLERVVAPPELEQDLRRGAEALEGAVDLLHPHERLGEAEVRERVLRVEIDDLAEDVDGVPIPPGALVAGGYFVVGGERVAGEPELGVRLGELGDDVPEAVLQVGDVLVDDLADLLVNGDRCEVEALRRVERAHALVGRDRVGVELHLEVEVADLEQRPDVLRVVGDELLVLDDSLVVALLLDKLLRCLKDLVAIDRHDDEDLLG